MPSAEDPDQAIQSVLHTLTASALRSNLTRCEALHAALGALEQGRVEATVLVAAERAAHQIVGSAGTFGFPRVSELAAELELYLARTAAPADPGGAGTTDPAAELIRARNLLTQMQAELESGSTDGHQPVE